MISVVDAVMGSGKSSAAITYMNEHPEKRYLYVTPFLDETERIARECAQANFIEPSDRIKEFGHSKRSHLRYLVSQHRNVSLTHALFLMIDDITAQMITNNGYTIIIDEVIDVFEMTSESEQDIDMLVSNGYLDKIRGDGKCEYYKPNPDNVYLGGVFNDFFSKARYGELVMAEGMEDGTRKRFGFWQINLRLFQMSEDIYILTYLFDGMPMKGFLESYGLKFQYIGTKKCEDGKYRFCDKGVTPEYVGRLSEMIHVNTKDRLNAIGDEKYALSVKWFNNATVDGRLAQLSRNIQNFFRKHIPAENVTDRRLWTVFSDFEKRTVREKFGTFLIFNSKAVNSYGDKSALAYCVNINPNPPMKNFLSNAHISMNWDQYAVAVMVQWIWRSRIRNNQEIWLYIPSRRMRTLFLNWMRTTEEAYKKEHGSDAI